MTLSTLPNSAEARDVRYHLHSQTNPARHENRGPMILARGDGPYVEDAEGRRYIDAMAGLWCASLGFAHHRLARAASRAYETLGYYHTFGGRTPAATIDAAEAIAALVPIEDAHVYFATSGSEAVETMVKLAWLHHAANGAPQRRKIVARDRAFHGSTIFAASLTGLPHMHREFGLPLPGIIHAACPDAYRGKRDDESDDAFATRLAAGLEKTILAEGPNTIAAFLAEPINAGAGIIVPPETYFPKVQEVLERHGILFLADEIVCGFGRTGEWFGCASVGARPDMMAMAKGLSSSYFPISAVALGPGIYESVRRFNEAGGSFGHGFTNSGHPVGAAIVRETLAIYREMDVIARVRELGERLRSGLEAAVDGSRIVGDLRGRGLMMGAELVADRATKASFPIEAAVPARLEALALKRGLILRPQGQTITFCPPFVIDEAQVDEIVDKFAGALSELEGTLS